MNSALVTWVGQADLSAAEHNAEHGPGPVAGALSTRGFDRVELLCNYPENKSPRT